MALTGSMAPYLWGINDELWPNVDPPVIREGQRVVLDMQNLTSTRYCGLGDGPWRRSRPSGLRASSGGASYSEPSSHSCGAVP
jgi:hypothetical protein